MLTRIFLQANVEKPVSSFRREKEAYKAMSDHNHTGFIWDHAMNGVNRHKGPSKDSPKILPALHAGQSLIVLCYSLGDDMEFPNPFSQIIRVTPGTSLSPATRILVGTWLTYTSTPAATSDSSSERKANATYLSRALLHHRPRPTTNRVASMEKSGPSVVS